MAPRTAARSRSATPRPKTKQANLRVSADMKDKLARYAKLTGRPQGVIAAEAFAHYLSWRIPQTKDLADAIAAADRGEFAEDGAVKAVFARYARTR